MSSQKKKEEEEFPETYLEYMRWLDE